MHRSKRPRAGFTLIELLVVTAIALLLIGLIVGVGSRWLGSSAKQLATTHRMNQVLNGLEQYSTEGDLAARLQRVGGFDLELVSLRQIVTLLTDTYGHDIRTMERGEHLPPRLGNRWQNAIHKDTLKSDYGSSAADNWSTLPLDDSTKADQALMCRSKWPSPNTGLDDVITFSDRQIAMEGSSGSNNGRITANYPYLADFYKLSNSPDWWGIEAWDDISASSFVGSYNETLAGVAGSFLTRRGTKSPLGESLDGTLEVQPDGQVRASSWYYVQWPNLIETIGPNSSGDPTFQHEVWPESDWNQSTPGAIPVVWAWPWGKQVFSRTEGGLLSQTEYRVDSDGDLIERTLADLNPLKTIALLQAAGIVASNAEGEDNYRTSRNPDKQWNDAWGSPLVVACAHFMPARYDFDDVNDLQYHNEIGAEVPKGSRDALGGRDFFLQKAKEVYGYSRSFYATVGSTGGSHGDIIPNPWEASDDDATLRDLWLRICTVTNAGQWTGSSWDAPPWSGLNSVEGANGITCHILSPKEYR